jgi:hypothetical protein
MRWVVVHLFGLLLTLSGASACKRDDKTFTVGENEDTAVPGDTSDTGAPAETDTPFDTGPDADSDADSDSDSDADSDADADPNVYVAYDNLEVCENDDCWCRAVRDCAPISANGHTTADSSYVSVCGYQGVRCIFRYEEEIAGDVSRYLCNVPKGRTDCNFLMSLECNLIDQCVSGACTAIDICALYEPT